MNSLISILLLAIAVPVSMAHGQEIKRAERLLVQPKEAPTLDTTLPISQTPIICVDNLSESELARRTELATGLRQLASEVKPVKQGFQVRFSANKNLAEVVEWIALERRCCPFLTFELVFPPDDGVVSLRIVGGEGVREFLASTFFASDANETRSSKKREGSHGSRGVG